MSKILWIAPHLNHYKARCLNRLALDETVDLTVLSGRIAEENGHMSDSGVEIYRRIHIDVSKNSFQLNYRVYCQLIKILNSERYDIVLIPLERRLSLIIIFMTLLRLKLRYKLVSYNHPLHRSAHSALARLLIKILYKFYDRIIFYTEKGMLEAVAGRIIGKNKAYFANNTLDTNSIWEHYSFEVNCSSAKRLLFIGRMTRRKRLDLLLEYFREFQKIVPVSELVIIGDGPEEPAIRQAILENPAIFWKGRMVDEKEIAEVMKSIHVVFIPGHSGLSIVHAFAYGKPYITMANQQHPPEIDYLEDDVNGLLLKGDLTIDCERIATLLNTPDQYTFLCRQAFQKAQCLSIENWLEGIKIALTF